MLYINSFINSPKNSNTPTIFNFEFLKFLYLIYLASQLVLMTPSSYFIEFIFFCYCRLFQAVKKYFSYVLGIVVIFPCSEIYFPLFFSPFFILNETSSDQTQCFSTDGHVGFLHGIQSLLESSNKEARRYANECILQPNSHF